jgi:hypothetical protein
MCYYVPEPQHHVMETFGERGGLAPHINFRSMWRWAVCFTLWLPLLRVNSSRCPPDRKLGGPQSSSGHCGDEKKYAVAHTTTGILFENISAENQYNRFRRNNKTQAYSWLSRARNIYKNICVQNITAYYLLRSAVDLPCRPGMCSVRPAERIFFGPWASSSFI